MLQEMKAFTIDAMSSNSMKSSNPHSGIHETDRTKCLDTMCLNPSCNQGGCVIVMAKQEIELMQEGISTFAVGGPRNGFYETDVSRTIDVNCGNPACNQGGMLVIALEGNGARPSHFGKGFSNDGQMYTLNTIEQHSICYQKVVGALCEDDWRMINKQYVDQNKVICYEKR